MLVYLYQLCEQVVETPLLRQGFDFVVSSPKVTDQDALEQDAKHLFDYRRPPASGYQIVAKLPGCEAP